MNMFALLMAALWTGVVSSIAAKTAYDVDDSSPHCQTSHGFEKSFFFTFAMFVGEAGCLAYYYMYFSKPLEPQEIMLRMRSPTGNVADSIRSPSVNESDLNTPKPPLPKWVFALLCLFDTTATSVNFIGLKWISASLNQMFRGALVIFVALFSIAFLKRYPTKGQWIGLAAVTLGIVVCGIGSVISSDDSSTGSTPLQTIVGVLLTILSCVLNGAQNVLEEKLMKVLDKYAEPHPMEIVGWEGIFGGSLVLFVILPIAQFIPGSDCGGVVENSLDSAYIFTHDWRIFILVFLFIVSLGAMNGLSMEIGRVLSAVYRNLISVSRVICVWLVEVIIYYTLDKSIGEKLTVYSLIQLLGFFLIAAGSVYYSRSREVMIGADGVAIEGEDLWASKKKPLLDSSDESSDA